MEKLSSSNTKKKKKFYEYFSVTAAVTSSIVMGVVQVKAYHSFDAIVHYFADDTIRHLQGTTVALFIAVFLVRLKLRVPLLYCFLELVFGSVTIYLAFNDFANHKGQLALPAGMFIVIRSIENFRNWVISEHKKGGSRSSFTQAILNRGKAWLEYRTGSLGID